ncbi:MAG: hypothetical protein KAH21_03355 [Spirochaetaceae bacterium]|nr:hypothetical protein [Spirochaetaceae bacterium]
MSFSYPVAERALKKWAKKQLEREPAENGLEHFSYIYHGSTCNNGGTPFTAVLHAVIKDSDGLVIIEKAWIEIPEDEKEAASEMCAAPGSGAEDAMPFFQKLGEPADFIGRDLESVILEDVPQNFAGCFCGRSHINQKWKIALSTIHYFLNSEAG